MAVVYMQSITNVNSENRIMHAALSQLSLMFTALIFTATICSQSLGQTAPPLDTDAEVTDIVREVVSRHGGQQAIDRWNCGTITYSARGNTIPADGVATHTEAFDFPGKFRRLATIEFPGVRNQSQMLAIINQQGSWLVINDGEPIVSDGTFAQRDRHSFANVISVAHLDDLVNDITKGLVLDVDGSPSLQLTLAVEQANPVDYLIDINTGLLALMSKRGFDPTSGREAMIVTRFGQYKVVDGAPVPMTFSTTADGRLMVSVQILSIDFKKSHSPGTFDLPKRF